MAEFGIKATGLSQPNTPAYIKPGVVDQSSGMMANTIAGLIPGAVTAAEGLIQMDTRLESNKLIDRLGTPEEVAAQDAANQETELNIGASVQGVNNIWDRFDSGVDAMPKVNVLERDIKANVDKLRISKEQGKIGDEEFLARHTKLIREKVTKYPWMEAEIYKASQTHLAAMGITSMLDEREKAAKATAKAIKDDRDAAQGASLSRSLASGPNVTTSQMWENVNEYDKKVAGNKNLDLAMEAGVKADEFMLRTPEGMRQAQGVLEVRANDFRKMSSTMLEGVRGGPQFAAAIASLKDNLRKDLSRMETFSSKAPTAIKMYEGYVRELEGFLKGAEELGDGTAIRKYVENNTAITKAGQDADFMLRFPDARAQEHAAKIAQGLGVNIGSLIKADDKAATRLLSFLASTAGGLTTPSRAGLPETQAGVNDGTASNIFTQFSENGLKLNKMADNAAYNNYITGMTDAVMSPNGNPVEQQRTAAIVLGKVANNPDFNNMKDQPDFERNIKRLVDVDMKGTFTNLQQMIAREQQDNPNVDIEFDITDTGKLVMIGSGLDSEDLNKKYGIQINNALDAYARSMGKTREQAAATFYPAYFADLTAKDPDLIKLIKGNERPMVEGSEPVNLGQPITGVETIRSPTPTQPSPEPLAPLRESAIATGPTPLTSASEIRSAFEEGLITADQFKSNMRRVEGEKAKAVGATPPTKLESTRKAERYLQEREARIEKTKEAVKETVGQAASNLIEAGTPIVEAYKAMAEFFGKPLKEVMDAELEYRMRVQGKKPSKYQESKDKEVTPEKRSAAEPDFLKSISEAIASLNKPVSIVRGPDGKITGLA